MLNIIKAVSHKLDCQAELICVVFMNISCTDIQYNPLMRHFHTFLM